MTNRTPPLGRYFDARSLARLSEPFDWRITGKWMVYSALIGVAGALGALLFSTLLGWMTKLSFAGLLGYRPPVPGSEAGAAPAAFDLRAALQVARPWLLPLVPMFGGLLAGLLVYRFAPEAEGHGTDAVIRSFHRQGGHIRPRVPLVKTVASALTIGTGGSAGREGPIAQIGAGFGSYLATRLRIGDRDRRLFLVAGMAAGIGSIFQSPLGAAFFAVEVLYREDIESGALMPAVVASVTGYSVYSRIVGSNTIFATPDFVFGNPLELLPLIALAPVCGAVGILYVRLFYGVRGKVFAPLGVPPWLKPALGGLAVGGLALFVPAILGSSYGWLQEAIRGNLPVTLMLVMIPAKIVATSLTIGSGGSGGVFAPSLVIGGMLGGVFGSAAHAVLPQLVQQPSAYVLIGMATFFAGVANVPISTTIMISEMTGSYALLIPLIFSGVVVHLMCRRWSLYTQQVRSHNESPAHRAELASQTTPRLTAAQLLQPLADTTLAPASTLDEIITAFTRTQAGVLPVAAQAPSARPAATPATPLGEAPAAEAPAAGASAGAAPATGTPGAAASASAAPAAPGSRYSGLVFLEEIQSLLQSDRVLKKLVIARDVETAFVSLSPDDPFEAVLAAFEKTGYPELPVTGADGRILGLVRQSDLAREYRRLALFEQAGERPAREEPAGEVKS